MHRGDRRASATGAEQPGRHAGAGCPGCRRIGDRGRANRCAAIRVQLGMPAAVLGDAGAAWDLTAGPGPGAPSPPRRSPAARPRRPAPVAALGAPAARRRARRRASSVAAAASTRAAGSRRRGRRCRGSRRGSRRPSGAARRPAARRRVVASSSRRSMPAWRASAISIRRSVSSCMRLGRGSRRRRMIHGRASPPSRLATTTTNARNCRYSRAGVSGGSRKTAASVTTPRTPAEATATPLPHAQPRSRIRRGPCR